MSDENLQARLNAIKQLLGLFRFERAVYLCVTVISLAVLLAVAISLFLSHKAGPAEIAGLFGSSGAITYTTGRLLKMWSDALRVVATVKGNGEEG